MFTSLMPAIHFALNAKSRPDLEKVLSALVKDIVLSKEWRQFREYKCSHSCVNYQGVIGPLNQIDVVFSMVSSQC